MQLSTSTKIVHGDHGIFYFSLPFLSTFLPTPARENQQTTKTCNHLNLISLKATALLQNSLILTDSPDSLRPLIILVRTVDVISTF